MRARQDFTTRTAEPADAEAITHVHKTGRASYYGDALDLDDAQRDRQPMWSQIIKDPTKRTAVAEHDGQVVGFITVTPAMRSESRAELTSIYVLPSFFGAGVAQQLYDLFLIYRGSHGAQLEVWDGNDRAKAFYARRGWSPTDQSRPGAAGRPFVTWHLAGIDPPERTLIERFTPDR